MLSIELYKRRRIPKDKKWTIQRNWQHNLGYTRRRKTKQKHITIRVGYYYMQTHTHNAHKT
jgi:hypothetical protein